MNVIKRFAILAMSSLVPATASAQDLRQEWFQCQNSADCVIVSAYCGFDWAINKNQTQQVEQAVKTNQACLKTGTHDAKLFAQCVDNLCQTARPAYVIH